MPKTAQDFTHFYHQKVITMRIIRTCESLREQIAALRSAGKSIGLVPTMGALHDGHLSLVRRSLERADITVVSIFVNPTQFAPTEDFDRYPRTLEQDVQLLERLEHDFDALRSNDVLTSDRVLVFAPSASEMYPPGFCTYVETQGVALPLEGDSRPTHFRGVATVVLKLFLLTRADFAFFGQKDFQQVQVVRQFVRDLDVPVEIVMCPIHREPDGLAQSSRNRYLSPEERQRALVLVQSLKLARGMIENGCRDTALIRETVRNTLEIHPSNRVDYVAIVHPDSLAEQGPTLTLPVAVLLAVRVGATRLIDNLLVE